jgi:hypothetical protein
MAKAREYEDFLNEDIAEFSDLCDVFFKKLVNLNKCDGLTIFFIWLGWVTLRTTCRSTGLAQGVLSTGVGVFECMIMQMFSIVGLSERVGREERRTQFIQKMKP